MKSPRPDDVVSARPGRRRRACSSATRSSTYAGRASRSRVVSPASFRHFGLAYGHGIAGNLRRRPWARLLAPALPPLVRDARPGGPRATSDSRPRALASVRAARARDAEAVRRAALGDRRRARAARAVGISLAPPAARAARPLPLGDARRVRRDGSARGRCASSRPGSTSPTNVAEPEDPPHVLYVGRLSEEKGVRELLEATAGLPRVIVGDGPLRDGVPEAVGFVPPRELGAYYERAAVVACPSRREGYGVVAREAMAHGRPVVATAVGGLRDAVEERVTGLLVPPSDPTALRRGDRAPARGRGAAPAPGRGGAGEGARGALVGCGDRGDDRRLPRGAGRRLGSATRVPSSRARALRQRTADRATTSPPTSSPRSATTTRASSRRRRR